MQTALLRSIGLGCAIAIVVTMAVNLSLTPAMLMACPAFFEACIQPINLGCLTSKFGGPKATNTAAAAAAKRVRQAQRETRPLILNDDARPDEQTMLGKELRDVSKGKWYKFARAVPSEPTFFPRCHGAACPPAPAAWRQRTVDAGC